MPSSASLADRGRWVVVAQPEDINLALFGRKNQVQLDAEKAKIMAATAIAEAMPHVVRVVMELLHHEDPQVQLRAADLLMSRAISKMAAKHIQEDPNTVETADVAALRESILNEIQKRR